MQVLKGRAKQYMWGLAGLLGGGGVAMWLLGFAVPVLWLVAAFGCLAALLAWWQTDWIQASLVGSGGKTAGVEDKQWGLRLRYWLVRLGLFLLLLLAVMVGESFWWLKTATYNVTEMDAESKVKNVRWYALPTEYALQRVLWQLGMWKMPAMQEIPAGEFQMGSDKGADDEKPVHTVTFKQPFNMSRNEITFAEYDYYVWLMRENGMEDVQYPHDEGWGRGEYPVINVSWGEAQGYVTWLSRETGADCRLPTEAEWEYAARAGTTTNYFWGDDIGKNNANCNGCGSEWDEQTVPVGSFKTNAKGLQDMHGNVWEWVQDCGHDSYSAAPDDGSVWEFGGDCRRRMLRGGAWLSPPGSLYSSFRYRRPPHFRSNSIGFRIVCGIASTGD